MDVGGEDEVSEKAVRAMMRDGLSDETIAQRTGLDLVSILELRAAAAVQDRSGPSRGDRSGDAD